jgi:hypothetical protein
MGESGLSWEAGKLGGPGSGEGGVRTVFQRDSAVKVGEEDDPGLRAQRFGERHGEDLPPLTGHDRLNGRGIKSILV